MLSVALKSDVCAAWASLVFSRCLDRWEHVPNDELPIPESWVQECAYFYFLSRGGQHGFHLDDWFAAKRSLAERFRGLVSEFLEDEEPTEGKYSAGSIQSMSIESVEELDQSDESNEYNKYAVCQWNGKDVNMENMRFRKISENDPVIQEAAASLREFRDPFASATEEELAYWRDKVLAILPDTGEVIAVAESVQELRKLVENSDHCGRTWRLMDGPTGHVPLSLKEAEQDG